MSYGILMRMGVTKTIAGTVDAYVEIGTRLGRDHQWRQHVGTLMRLKKHLVYRDMECIAGLESFLTRATRLN